jgi:hypothetical protein
MVFVRTWALPEPDFVGLLRMGDSNFEIGNGRRDGLPFVWQLPSLSDRG